MIRWVRFLALCVCFALCAGCVPVSSSPAPTTTATTTTTTVTATTKVPVANRDEMRAVWFAFSDIRDFVGGKTVKAAKNALDTAMKQAVDFGLNTVIFHARVNSDAYYDSKLFKPAAAVTDLLDAGFDPLAYAIESAHRNGLKLHVWINPYRIGADKSFAVCDDVFELNDRYYYIPTSDKAQAAILNGVREVLSYDVDGLQFDDYFYPTGGFTNEQIAEFEQADYTAYTANGGTMTVGEWRRSHVSALVRTVYALVHAEKGRVFGISPSGNMTANFEDMYADTATWMANAGYIDYICPQLYVGFEHETTPFVEWTAEWLSQPRDKSVSLYGGLALYKAGILTDKTAGLGAKEWAEHNDVLARQVACLRNDDNFSGFMLFRQAHLTASAVRETAFDENVAEQELQHLREVIQ